MSLSSPSPAGGSASDVLPVKTVLTLAQLKQVGDVATRLQTRLVGPGGEFEIITARVHGHPTRSFRVIELHSYTLDRYFRDYAVRWHDRDFLVYGARERWTFGDVMAAAETMAEQLQRPPFAVRAGDRVALYMKNWPEWCVMFVAIVLVRAVAVPLNGWWVEDEVEYGLTNSGACMLICDEPRLRRALPTVEKNKQKLKVMVVRPSSNYSDPYPTYPQVLSQAKQRLQQHQLRQKQLYQLQQKQKEQLQLQASSSSSSSDAASAGPVSPAAAGFFMSDVVTGSPDDVAVVMYTSGSTAFPKGAVLTHRGILTQMKMTELIWTMQYAVPRMLNPAAPPELPYSSVLPIPLFHVTACHHLFISSFVLGRKMIIMDKWDAGHALSLMEKERVTHFTGVPTMVADMLEHPNFPRTNTSTLLFMGAGGAPTPIPQVHRVNHAFKLVARPQNGYGLTETNGAVAAINGDIYVLKPSSTGLPYPCVEAKLVDVETGAEVSGVGARGELLVRSALVMKEYWNNQAATDEAITHDRWFKTGDVATIDAEGYISIVDRAKQIIIRGGENISCAEVETVIHHHPAVMEVSAFGMPDARLGERVGVMIMIKPTVGPVDEAAFRREVVSVTARHLPAFKRPLEKDIFITRTPLPRGSTGKIQKREIKELVLKSLNIDIKPKSKL